MNAAIYLRVSTDRQDERNQWPDCIRLCEARGWQATVFSEVESAAKRRPVWNQVRELARRGKIRALVVWSLDRAGRTMFEIIANVRELDRLGCAVVSVQEPWLDTTGPARELLLAVFAWWAEQERRRLIERTRAGLARARSAGKRLGRPPVWVDPWLVSQMQGRGLSIAAMARDFGVARTVIRKALSQNGVPPAAPLPPGNSHRRAPF